MILDVRYRGNDIITTGEDLYSLILNLRDKGIDEVEIIDLIKNEWLGILKTKAD